MTSRRITRRTLFILLLVLTWVGLAADTSRALLSDGAQLTGTTISTGSAELLISNSQNSTSTTYASVRPGFEIRLTPGQDDIHFFLLKNVSDANADLAIDVSATLTAGSVVFRDAVTLEFVEVDGDGVAVGDRVSVPFKDIAAGARVAINSIVPKGEFKRYVLVTHLDREYSNAGDTLAFDLTLTGTQAISG